MDDPRLPFRCGSIAPALAANVGISLTAGQPGYHRIAMMPAIRTVYLSRCDRPGPGCRASAIDLHVSHKDAKDWRKHCKKYNACAQPVYFVSESWYNRRIRKGHGKGDDKGQGKKQKKD